ncbi:YdbL family protein [Thermodesulfobacteriota bacterium]
MKRATLSSLMIILSIILLSSTVTFSQDIKERMKERLPVIVELKNKGIIGENSLGYLEFVGAARVKQDVVSAENKDREIVYKAIAGKQNTTAEKVGKRRAQQIAQKADPGDWLKNEKGKWYQK